MNETKSSGAVKALLVIGSVLLCLLLFVSSVATMLVADVRVVTSKSNLQKIISEALFTAPVRPAAAGIAVGRPARMAASGSSSQIQDALVDNIYDLLIQQFGDKVPLTQEQVQEFVDQSTLSEFMSEKIASVINDIYTGESTTTLTREEVETFLEDNNALIQQTFNRSLSENDIGKIADWVESSNVMEKVEEQVSQITGIGTSSGTSSDGSAAGGTSLGTGIHSNGEITVSTIPAMLNTLRTATSVGALMGCIAVCLALTGLLFLTNWKKFHKALISSGITYLVAGLLFLLPSGLAAWVPSLFAGTAGAVIRQVLLMTGMVSGTVAILGLGLLIGGIVWGNLSKKRQAAAEA